MIDNIEIIISLIGGFFAVIGLQLNMLSLIRDNKKQLEAQNVSVSERLTNLQKEFDLCRAHCKMRRVGGVTNGNE